MSSTGSPVVAAFQNSSSVSTESTASPSTHFFRQSRSLPLGRSPPHAPTHNANGPDGGLRQLHSPPRLKCLPKGRPSSRFRPWFFDIDGSGSTGGSMIRHAPEAALFPVDPLPVPVIEPSFRAVLVFPVGTPHLLASHPAAAPLPAIDLPPVAGMADPEHHATACPPANPLTQELFVGSHPALAAGRDNRDPSWQSRSHLQMTWGRFFGPVQKNPIRRLTAGGFPFRLRTHPARASASLTDDEDSTSRYRRSSKKTQPCSLLSLVLFFPLRR